MKIIQLERQLNAIYNKEEEERIRKEDAAKENGWIYGIKDQQLAMPV